MPRSEAGRLPQHPERSRLGRFAAGQCERAALGWRSSAFRVGQDAVRVFRWAVPEASAGIGAGRARGRAAPPQREANVVKKSSFFDKLKHRWKSPSGVQVGGAEGGERRAANDVWI